MNETAETTEANSPVAKFRVGEVVRLKNNHSHVFRIKECYSVVDEIGEPKKFRYRNYKNVYNECDLELVPKIIKQKVRIWMNMYKGDDGQIHTGGKDYSTKLEAQNGALSTDYLGARCFETEFEVEEK